MGQRGGSVDGRSDGVRFSDVRVRDGLKVLGLISRKDRNSIIKFGSNSVWIPRVYLWPCEESDVPENTEWRDQVNCWTQG